MTYFRKVGLVFAMYNEQAHYIGTNNKYYVIRNGIILVILSNVVVVVSCNIGLLRELR